MAKFNFVKQQVSDQTESFADDSFKFDENGRKFSKKVETRWEMEKLLVTSNFSFSNSVFKTFLMQTHKNKRLFQKGVRLVNHLEHENNKSD